MVPTASRVCIVVTVAAFCQARDKQAFSRLGRVFRVSGLNARVVGWGLSRLLNLIPSQCGQARSKQTMVHDDTPGYARIYAMVPTPPTEIRDPRIETQKPKSPRAERLHS